MFLKFWCFYFDPFIVLCVKCVIELQLPIKVLFQKKKEI